MTTLKTDEAVVTLFNKLKPLIDTLPYIREFRIAKPDEHADWNSADFRGAFHRRDHSLMQAHALHYHSIFKQHVIHDPMVPWIPAPQDEVITSDVIINRTSRYRNPFFPWKAIVEHYADRIRFIGHPAEHREFCDRYGDVTYQPTADYLWVARAIAASQLFIGNQSSCYAVAEGLKHNTIQETCLDLHDCIFKRPNAVYVGDGAVTLPDIAGSGTLSIPAMSVGVRHRRTNNTPPGGFTYNGINSNSTEALVSSVKSVRGNQLTEDQIREAILEEQHRLHPEFYRNTWQEELVARFNEEVAAMK